MTTEYIDPRNNMKETDIKEFHLYLVSDSTGETINSVAKAVCACFVDAKAIEHSYGLVRSDKQLERVLEVLRMTPGPVLYSMVEGDIAKKLERACKQIGVPCLNVLDPFVNIIGSHLGVEIRGKPGMQHQLTAEYFERIGALNYTVAHDDGQSQGDLNEADVILVGVSRTSKTPTCMYLANRGVRAANVPYVPRIDLPPELFDVTEPLIVGLAASPERLVQIRKNRLLSLNEASETDYINPDQVKDETQEARRFFKKMGWPIIDVTRRSIEETSTTILNLLERRKEEKLKQVSALEDK